MLGSSAMICLDVVVDDVIGGFAALFVGLIEGFVVLILIAAELVALLVELLIWALLCLFGRRYERPHRRQFGRRDRMRSSRAPFLTLIVVGFASLLAFVGVKVYQDVLTVTVQARSATGWPVGAVEVEWIEAGGERRFGVIESGGSRYWKRSWDQLSITDERFESAVVELTKKDQLIVLEPTPVETLKQKAAMKAVETGVKAFSHMFSNKEDSGQEE